MHTPFLARLITRPFAHLFPLPCRLLKLDLKPRDIMTKAAFENAIRMVMMTGGSTNAVLHLIAMSRSTDNPDAYVSLDDFQRLSDITPFLADRRSSRRRESELAALEQTGIDVGGR